MSINKHNTPFNVLRHNVNSFEIAPRDPVSIIATAITFGATSGAVYWTAYVLTYVALTMVTTALVTALTPKPDQNPNNSNGLQVNSKNALAPMQFLLLFGIIKLNCMCMMGVKQVLQMPLLTPQRL